VTSTRKNICTGPECRPGSRLSKEEGVLAWLQRLTADAAALALLREGGRGGGGLLVGLGHHANHRFFRIYAGIRNRIPSAFSPDQHSSITDFAAPANVGASRDPNGADASFNENR
jgi:hypothetical protein